jgi:hypothetical protein
MKKTICLVLLILLILTGCSEEKWKESSIFHSGGYSMIGKENKVGFIYDDSGVSRFYPGKEQKYMWHLWGSDVAGQKLKVTATKEGTTEEIPLLGELLLSSAHNGADAATPSGFSLPEAGMWKLTAYVNNKKHGTVFVKVHDR